jgi:DNA-binding winged helix-turn-helix (wHTH) protein
MERANALSDFSEWSINLDHYSLEHKDREEIFIEPRLLKLLNFLYANANKVVKRAELMDLVWEDVVVTEESLTKAIFDLRKFLQENFNAPPQIVTIRKVGYKLVLQQPSTPVKTRYRVLRLVGKALVYIVLFAVVFSILVRAIRYEN